MPVAATKTALSTLSLRPIVVPRGITFSSLKLLREDNILHVDYDAFLKAWIASGYPADLLYASNVSSMVGFIARWYLGERSSGRGSDQQDKLIESIVNDCEQLRILPR